MTRRKIGDRVILTRTISNNHFKVAGMTITGKIEEIELEHLEGINLRPYKIRFDDDRYSWYGTHEIRRI